MEKITMKKWMGLALAGLVLAAPMAASAADYTEFLKDPVKYRVLYAGEDEVVYADMDTVMGQQTLDYPGSIENVHMQIYVESYKDKVDAFDFAKGKLVTQVRKFDVQLHADKRAGTYDMKTKLDSVYGWNGESLAAIDSAKPSKKDLKLDADAKDLYFNLYRLMRIQK